MPIRLRCSFTPEVLAKLALLVDNIKDELVKESQAKFQPSQSTVAKKTFALARYPWTDRQLKELLLRAFRNEQLRLNRTLLAASTNPQLKHS
jgi:hypothetical protein